MSPDPFAPVDPDTPLRFDHLLHLLTNFSLCAAAVVVIASAALVYWRLHSPETYEERFATPVRLLRWRLWAHISWQKLCKRCGLSASEQVTRRDNEGRQVTSTRWFHPKLLGTDVSHTTLRLTVRARMGQTVEDLERAVPAIRDAAGAHSARSVVIAPGTLRIELVMREQLSSVGHASPPTAVATTRIDLKYGIELSVGSGLFTKIATTEADAVETLAALEKLMNKRGNAMAGRTREHSPTKASPLVMLLIDELAGVTAYMSDPALRKEAAASLSRILTKGRALGIVVAAFLQDPRKEVLPMRGLFTQTIALRLRSRDEVTMVLGDGMADAAPAHRISPERPGTGYVIAEDGQVTKVRSDFWSDNQIRSTAKQYGRVRTSGGKRND
ncbi:cell division protein Ftsk/SpoIIIE [Mycobacteroides abscessus subsp. abscessus]|nr:cell division protein Ftsk/SpoIIIE [Mycobacteroides abscessus subsp. abscessus]